MAYIPLADPPETPTPGALAHASRCYCLCIPPGMERAVELYLLTRLVQAVDPSFIMTPSQLANAARCFNSCIPPGMEAAVANYLLNALVNGTGSTGGIYQGVGDPNVAGLVPATPALPAYYNEYTAGGVPVETWWWNTVSQTWV